MANKVMLPGVFGQMSETSCFLVGNNRIEQRKGTASDYSTVVVGLSLFIGILLDFNEQMVCEDRIARQNRVRILNYPGRVSAYEVFPLGKHLTYLDELDGILMDTMSSVDDFKGRLFLKRIKSVLCSDDVLPLRGIIVSLLVSACADINDDDESAIARLYALSHQVFTFLKKLDVTREDLATEMEQEFFDFEEHLSNLRVRQESNPEYHKVVGAMKALLLRNLDGFSMHPFVPKHGPGAVADAGVKSWYDKNRTATKDSRITYLLDHQGLGIEEDYLPVSGESSSTRTSRYITVPKTWKKLRGISAEPTELQFWQQGVLHRIDSMFRQNKWWKSRVNLHDQERSRKEALTSSITGSFATVDLSAASDSVSLQLVKDVFGNTSLSRWLLGTRSTHTMCGNTSVKVQKFSPMGSACCFPVECMIFTLAAEVACSLTPSSLRYSQEVIVYGDDIILPYYAVDELLRILDLLGFSINKEKSYWEGHFREACGVEAWKGYDVASCKFRSYKSGVVDLLVSHDEYSSMLALANELFARGLHATRKMLLEFLFSKRTWVGKNLVSVQRAVYVSFSGERNTLSSPCPTNFQIRRKFDTDLQTYKVLRLTWQRKPKSRVVESAMADSLSSYKYVEWLIRHQADVTDFEDLWKNGWIESKESNPYDRLPIDQMMVPTFKWVLEPRCLHL